LCAPKLNRAEIERLQKALLDVRAASIADMRAMLRAGATSLAVTGARRQVQG
jgi:hypothetical protein